MQAFVSIAIHSGVILRSEAAKNLRDPSPSFHSGQGDTAGSG